MPRKCQITCPVLPAVFYSVCTIFSSPASAGNPQQNETAMRLPVIAAGLNVGFFRYHEIFSITDVKELLDVDSVVGEMKSDEYGLVPSFRADLSFPCKKMPLFFRAMLETGSGEDTYDGSMQTDADTSSGTNIEFIEPFSDSKKNTFFSSAVNAGGMISAGRVLVLPYTGLEFSYWKRVLPGSSLISNERYSWYNVPVGMKLFFPAGEKVDAGIDFAAKFIVYGKMEPRISGLAGLAVDDISISTVTLGRRWGFTVQAPFVLHTSLRWLGVLITPWFEYRHFGRSPTGTLEINDSELGSISSPFYEPESVQHAFGIRFAASLDSRIFR